MSHRDKIIVAFRASKEEADRIDDLVDESGMTKQDYILYALLHHDQPILINPCLYLQLKRKLDRIEQELKRIQTSSEVDEVSHRIEALLPLLERIRLGGQDE